jgi:ribonuclease VapC
VNQIYVLDSFALLAFLGGERGGATVKKLLVQAKQQEIQTMMTWVNVGEIAYIIERRWGKERVYQVIGTLEATAVEIIDAGRDLSLRAADIKANYPLAVREKAILVTGDPEFKQVADFVKIEWLPQENK